MFTGGALRLAKGSSAIPGQGLIPVPSVRRCLRPINDYNEMAERKGLGGSLKYEGKFSYEFRIHDVFVDASDFDLLEFDTDPPKAHDDPFGIRTSAPAVYWAYQAAKKFRHALLNETKKQEVVIQWLCTKSPQSPYQTEYVADQIFKYINPHHRRGRGAKVPPFDRETLRSFRDQYPDEKDTSDGLALIICASIWWSKEYGRRLQDQAYKMPIKTTVDKKLEHYGFYGLKELEALCKVIMHSGRNSGARPKTKTKSEKKLKMLTRPTRKR